MAVFAEPLALSAGDVFLTASIGVAALGAGVGCDRVRPDPPCRHGHVPGQVGRPELCGRVRRVDARPCRAPARVGDGFAPRTRPPRAAALSPADLEPTNRHGHRLRGADALATRGRLDRLAGGVHPDRRGQWDDRRARRVGIAGGHDPTAAMDRRRHVPARLDDVGERVTEAIRRRRLPRGRRAKRCTVRGCRRGTSGSK